MTTYLSALSEYKFIEDDSNKCNKTYLGLQWIKEGNTWKKILIPVDKSLITRLNIFKSYFGYGQLQNISVSLNTICSELSEFSWTNLQNSTNPTDINAFKTLCQLANRQLIKRNFDLFKKVSTLVPGKYKHYWNPAMNVRFLTSYQNYRLPYAYGLEIRTKDSQEKLSPYFPIPSLKELGNLEVGYNYEHYSETFTSDDTTKTIDHYKYPEAPYYQVNPHEIEKFVKRNSLENIVVPKVDTPLKNTDEAVLANYEFTPENRNNSQIIGLESIKVGSQWEQKLVLVNRVDATCFQLFLSHLELGKFANTSFSIKKISEYLSQHNLLSKAECTETLEKALITTCEIANRTFSANEMLFKAISEPISGNFKHYWNPAMNGRFLLKYHKHCLPQTVQMHIRYKDSLVGVDSFQKMTKDQMAFIEVGYDLEYYNDGRNVRYLLPQAPYYTITPYFNAPGISRREI